MTPRTIDEMLRAGVRPLHSFEFFPPKTLEGDSMLWRALVELDELEPDFVSFTYGANGSRRDMTVTLTARLAQLMNERQRRDPDAHVMQVMGHLTAVSQPIDQLGERAAKLLLEHSSRDGGHRHRQVLLAPELVIRRSTGRRAEAADAPAGANAP